MLRNVPGPVPDQAKSSDSEPSHKRRIDDRFRGIWITVGLLVALVVFTVALPGLRFLGGRNLANIALDSVTILILAVPTTLILISKGIDLSVGATLVLSSVVVALVIRELGGSPEEVQMMEFPQAAIAVPVAILAGLGTGLVCGGINGVLIAKLRIPPFIATLGTMGMYFGFAQILSGGTNQVFIPVEMQQVFGAQRVFGVPVPVLLGVGIALVVWIWLERTRGGMRTYAIGANSEGARLAGVNVNRHLIRLYVFAGFCSAIAGIVDVSRFRATAIEGHTLDNLEAITAAVLGGTSLFGGVGGVPGTIIGSVFPSVLSSGFIQLRVPPFWQPVVLGAVLILAVWYDRSRRDLADGME